MAIRQIRFVSDGSEYGGNYIDVATGQSVIPTPMEQVASQAYSQSGGGVPWDQFAQQYLGRAGSNIGFQGTPEALNAAVTGSNYQSLFPTISSGNGLFADGGLGDFLKFGGMVAGANAFGPMLGSAMGGGAAIPAASEAAMLGGPAVTGSVAPAYAFGGGGALSSGIEAGMLGGPAVSGFPSFGVGIGDAATEAAMLGGPGVNTPVAPSFESAGYSFGGGGGAPSPSLPSSLPPTPPTGGGSSNNNDWMKYAPLAGAAIGAGAGALGGSGKQGSITVEDGIPDWLMPYMKPALDRYSTELQNYQTDPYGIMPSAMKEFQNTISGQYLDPSTNKYLPEYFRLGAERVKGTLSPSFGHMQAFGGNTGYNEALSRGLSDLAVGLYGGAYDKERARQNEMIAAAPAFLTNSTQSAFVPYSGYLSAVSGLGKKREQPYFQPGPLQGILGGALAGYGLGGMFK